MHSKNLKSKVVCLQSFGYEDLLQNFFVKQY